MQAYDTDCGYRMSFNIIPTTWAGGYPASKQSRMFPLLKVVCINAQHPGYQHVSGGYITSHTFVSCLCDTICMIYIDIYVLESAKSGCCSHAYTYLISIIVCGRIPTLSCVPGQCYSSTMPLASTMPACTTASATLPYNMQ